jgi:hypothetical protein
MPLRVNLAHHPLDAFGVDLDLGHVLPQDPAGYVLRGHWGARWGLGADRGGTCSLRNHLLLAVASHSVHQDTNLSSLTMIQPETWFL